MRTGTKTNKHTHVHIHVGLGRPFQPHYFVCATVEVDMGTHVGVLRSDFISEFPPRVVDAIHHLLMHAANHVFVVTSLQDNSSEATLSC